MCIALLKIKRVKTKSIVYFCGLPHIENNGNISIGAHCRFMSKTKGNAIGLNHACMISTATKESKLVVGDNCSFSGVSIRCFYEVNLGNYVRVGANCLIIDGDAHQDDPRSGRNKPIFIEDNVWIGANVVVKKGVTIGRNSVIGMNSVVTKDIPANCIAIGNPCVVVKYFDKNKIKDIEEYFK